MSLLISAPKLNAHFLHSLFVSESFSVLKNDIVFVKSAMVRGGPPRLFASAFFGHKFRERAGTRLIFCRLIIMFISHNISKI